MKEELALKHAAIRYARFAHRTNNPRRAFETLQDLIAAAEAYSQSLEQ